MTILVTGGAGFIGTNFVIEWISNNKEKLINVDKLTYAGNLGNLNAVNKKDEHVFIKGDINNSSLIEDLFKNYQPRFIINFAAESHVDRSIENPGKFINTNIIGTYNLLECAKNYWLSLPINEKKVFRFLQVSTDEVYGTLEPNAPTFSELNRYEPNSPYSASKASADHLVRAYYQTYGLPVLTTHCSNNYGPFQFPEKLIPLTIKNALAHDKIPVYGDGLHIRDWLYVSDHCSAIRAVLERGRCGETYNIGGSNEKSNVEVVQTICNMLDKMHPTKNKIESYLELISFVKDRPGHDRRYAIDTTKISTELNWFPKENFESGISKTVQWYLCNQNWVEKVFTGYYKKQNNRHDR